MPAPDRPRGFVMWPADFLSDINVVAMETVEVGAYWLLCLYASQSDPPGSLPNDDALLARLTRLGGDGWEKHKDAVLRPWIVTPERIIQKRLTSEIRASADRKASAQNAGKRSAKIKSARALATHTEEEWARLLITCGGKCVRCGAVTAIQKDHIVPVYAGGSDGIANLQPLCASCNASKGPDTTDFRPPGWERAFNDRSTTVQQGVGVGVGVGVEESKSKAAAVAAPVQNPDIHLNAHNRPVDASDPLQASSPSAGSETPPAPGPHAMRSSALGLVNGLVAGMRLEPSTDTSKKRGPMLDAAWHWLRANTAPDRLPEAMRFVGWLVKTGTRDADMLLALAKHFTVHAPRNPHAYYTPNGTARQAIAARVASDAAIAEHERLKREDREFLGRS